MPTLHFEQFIWEVLLSKQTTTTHKISQYFPFNPLNSNVKEPTAPFWPSGGHLALLAHWTSQWGRRVRFWLRYWASVCKVTAASLVAPTATSGTDAVCVICCHPAGGKASQLPCDGSFRQRVCTCHQPSTQSHKRGGYSMWGGRKDYKQRWRTGLSILHINWSAQIGLLLMPTKEKEVMYCSA